jgi:tRNA threonylcarbamoyl adenosine modification protein YeaZ
VITHVPLTLALSTSSPALSIALVDGPAVLAHRHEVIGRGHAEALVPAIAALLEDRRPQHILVDIGPGSYTGIRIGIAAARALGVAWGVEVAGMSALSLVAAAAFAGDPGLTEVFALIDAGRGHAAGGRLGRDLVAPASQLVRSLPAAVVPAGAGAALIEGAPPARHGAHPDAAWAGHLPAAAWYPPAALYAAD